MTFDQKYIRFFFYLLRDNACLYKRMIALLTMPYIISFHIIISTLPRWSNRRPLFQDCNTHPSCIRPCRSRSIQAPPSDAGSRCAGAKSPQCRRDLSGSLVQCDFKCVYPFIDLFKILNRIMINNLKRKYVYILYKRNSIHSFNSLFSSITF